MCADQTPQAVTSRRRAIEIFLGGGILASLASFLYPVLRFFVPPAVVDLGGDEVVAAKLVEIRPNSGKIFRFGSRPGLLIMNSDGTYRAEIHDRWRNKEAQHGIEKRGKRGEDAAAKLVEIRPN